MNRITVGVSISPDLVEAVDRLKGRRSRSHWIEEAVEEKIEREERQDIYLPTGLLEFVDEARGNATRAEYLTKLQGQLDRSLSA